MATPSKRALVTGAGGFTGHYLCSYLADQGFEVLGLRRDAAESGTQQSFQTVVGNILDRSEMTAIIEQFQPTHVFHLAAIAFVAHGDQGDMYRVNTIGTDMLLSVIADTASAIEKVVIASSANIYGNPVSTPVAETAMPAPVNHYGCSKLSMEFIAKSYADRLPIVVARPFNYTGPGQDPKYLVPKMVAHFRDKKTEIELGNLDVTRDISDVRDIVRYYGALALQGEPGMAYNFCRGEGFQLREVIEMLQDICGYEIKVSVNPAFVRASDIQVLIGDADRLQTLDAGRPAYTFRQTLIDMLAN